MAWFSGSVAGLCAKIVPWNSGTWKENMPAAFIILGHFLVTDDGNHSLNVDTSMRNPLITSRRQPTESLA
jgi:hypothetical protein